MKQLKNKIIGKSEIRKFRDTLRRFERLVFEQFKGSSCCTEVSLTQCHALLEIEARGVASLNEVAKSLGLDKSTLSRTIDNLVDTGLVSRALNDEDRRSVELSLTSPGEKICDRINDMNDRLVSRVFEHIDEASRERVMGAFQELVSAWATEVECAQPLIHGRAKKREGK